MVICLEQGAGAPRTPSSLVSFKIQTGFSFLVLAYPGCPGKEAIKLV